MTNILKLTKIFRNKIFTKPCINQFFTHQVGKLFIKIFYCHQFALTALVTMLDLVCLIIYLCFRVTTPLRDYTKIEEKNCQLVTHYGGKEFNCLHGIAIGPGNEVIMVDEHSAEVIIFDRDLKLIRTFGQGSGDSKLSHPVGIATNFFVIAVSERDDHMVKIFSLQGDYLSKFGSYGSGNGQFNNPQGLCFNSKGLLYVVDCDNYRVQVFRENVFLFKFGSKGPNPGQFEVPCYIAVDSSDQVYVTDFSDGSGISVFSEDGYFIKKIDFNYPYAICIAPDDSILTDDDDGLTVFNPTLELIVKFGVHGEEKGQFNGICGIAINNSGTIFVTEEENKRLQIITP